MILETILLFLTLLFLSYVYITKNFGYFKSKGIPELPGSFPFGSENMKQMMTRKIGALELLDGPSKQFKDEKMYGYYAFRQKQLVIKDIELAKLILIKDADHFVDRPVVGSSHKEASSLTDKLFGYFITNLKGEEWKQMRTQVSPVFTSGKLKLMVPHINKCGINLAEKLHEAALSGEVLDGKEIYGKFALDAISTAGFGMETNSFKDPNNKFRLTALRMIRDENHSSKFDFLRFLVLMVSAKLGKLLGISALPPGTAEFFASILRKNIASRMESGVKRNDIVDLMVDELEDFKNGKSKLDPDVDLELALISTAILFFFAGFDTTSTTLTVVSYGLAMYPDVQERLRNEINEVIGDKEKITAEDLKELKFAEHVINESLRKFGIVQALQRICTKEYRVPGTDFTIPEGMIVNVHAKPYESECFANPASFDPENFEGEGFNKFGFVAFGQGPRNCIGMRYAYMALKIAVIHAVRNFKLVKCSETAEELKFDMFKNNLVGAKFKVELLNEE